MTKGCNPEPGQPFELWEDRYRVNVLIGAAQQRRPYCCIRAEDYKMVWTAGRGPRTAWPPLGRLSPSFCLADQEQTYGNAVAVSSARHRPRPAGGTPPTVPGAGDTLQPTVESDSMNTDERQSGGSAQPHGKQPEEFPQQVQSKEHLRAAHQV